MCVEFCYFFVDSDDVQWHFTQSPACVVDVDLDVSQSSPLFFVMGLLCTVSIVRW